MAKKPITPPRPLTEGNERPPNPSPKPKN